MRKLSTREQMAYRTIATLELERDAALGREDAGKNIISGQRTSLDVCAQQINTLQQRLTVAEQLLRETSDYLDGSTRNAVWCDSNLHKKMKAALKPAAEGEGK